MTTTAAAASYSPTIFFFRVNQGGTKHDTILDQRATVYCTKSLVVLGPLPFNAISSLTTNDYIVLPFDVISKTIVLNCKQLARE